MSAHHLANRLCSGLTSPPGGGLCFLGAGSSGKHRVQDTVLVAANSAAWAPKGEDTPGLLLPAPPLPPLCGRSPLRQRERPAQCGLAGLPAALRPNRPDVDLRRRPSGLVRGARTGGRSRKGPHLRPAPQNLRVYRGLNYSVTNTARKVSAPHDYSKTASLGSL